MTEVAQEAKIQKKLFVLFLIEETKNGSRCVITWDVMLVVH